MIVSEVGRMTSGSSSFFATSMRNHGQLGRKPRHVRLFLADETLRNQQRKRRVHMSVALKRRSSCAVMFSHSAQP